MQTPIRAGGSVMCSVRTLHGPFVGGGFEGADIRVTAPTSSHLDVCKSAKALAAIVWPNMH